MSRLVYIANARLPTEKAHGYQICKMCEAFVENSSTVLLLHPRRRQFDPAIRGQSVFDYYRLPAVFKVKALSNLDVVRIQPLLPRNVYTLFFFTHVLLWGFYAARAARREGGNPYYTRDVAVAYWLGRLGCTIVYEAHVVPKRAQRWLLQQIIQQPALRLVVVLTSFIKEAFVQMGCPAEKILVLPDAVDLSLFKDLPTKQECRGQLGLPLNRLIVGYIGRFRTLEMEKGIPELIEAVAHLPSINGAEPLLLCVGGPKEAVSSYLTLARRLNVSEQRLRFVDRVPNTEVPCWIRACDIGTVPWPWTEFSAYFTSPLKLFEYMAAGVPIIASDLPSIREVLSHGESAWLVEPGDPQALAEGIIHVLSNGNLSNDLTNRAGQEIAKYTWKCRARKILDRLHGCSNGLMQNPGQKCS
jgi:glycosyltransferase involved in cell wall biosynthesis